MISKLHKTLILIKKSKKIVVDNLPHIIKSNVNIQEAEQIKQKFEELGAIVDLK